MGFGVSLPHGPSLNLIEIDNLLCCDQDRLIESLPVAPMVERRKPVHDALRRCHDLYSQCTNRSLSPLANNVVANRQRPRGKFQGVRTCRVDEMTAGLASEPKPIQHLLEFPLTRGRNEVEITRLVESASVNLHCSPTGQHRGDSR